MKGSEAPLPLRAVGRRSMAAREWLAIFPPHWQFARISSKAHALRTCARRPLALPRLSASRTLIHALSNLCAQRVRVARQRVDDAQCPAMARFAPTGMGERGWASLNGLGGSAWRDDNCRSSRRRYSGAFSESRLGFHREGSCRNAATPHGGGAATAVAPPLNFPRAPAARSKLREQRPAWTTRAPAHGDGRLGR